MKNYLLTLLIVCLLTGGVCFLSSGSSHEKHLRYLCMLLTLLAMISPLPGLLSSFGQTEDPLITLPPELRSEYGELLKEQTEERLNENLQNVFFKDFDLAQNEIFVSCKMDLAEDGAFSLKGITVRLCSPKAVLKREALREYLHTLCDTVVFYEEL
ncbi:MAG: hypothetical protein IJZ37_02100 [Clostridia bacterium]|nr:hypothetical protein [Clostridia bacterium]MBQ8399086.1 hypothetical protein [Clostridia bacterium]